MTDQIDIIHGKSLIAKFMGGFPCIIKVKSIGEVNGFEWAYGERYTYEELQYNTSYDSIMAVWHKFKDLKFNDTDIQLAHAGIKAAVSYRIVNDTVDKIFVEMYTAISWYNQNIIKSHCIQQ